MSILSVPSHCFRRVHVWSSDFWAEEPGLTLSLRISYWMEIQVSLHRQSHSRCQANRFQLKERRRKWHKCQGMSHGESYSTSCQKKQKQHHPIHMCNSDNRKAKQNPQANSRAIGPPAHLSHHACLSPSNIYWVKGTDWHSYGRAWANKWDMMWKIPQLFFTEPKNKTRTSVSHQDRSDLFPASLYGLRFYHFPSFTKPSVTALLLFLQESSWAPSGFPPSDGELLPGPPQHGQLLAGQSWLGLICSERPFLIREPTHHHLSSQVMPIFILLYVIFIAFFITEHNNTCWLSLWLSY